MLSVVQLQTLNQMSSCTGCSSPRKLPVTALGNDTLIQYNQYWEGHKLPVIGVEPLGRLGNIMGEYATLFALQRTFNVSAVLTSAHEKYLRSFFPHLSLPVVNDGTCK